MPEKMEDPDPVSLADFADVWDDSTDTVLSSVTFDDISEDDITAVLSEYKADAVLTDHETDAVYKTDSDDGASITTDVDVTNTQTDPGNVETEGGTKRRRTEETRMSRNGWERVACGDKKQRFVYRGPDGCIRSSLKAVMDEIRLEQTVNKVDSADALSILIYSE
jgi:hypothetical protein